MKGKWVVLSALAVALVLTAAPAARTQAKKTEPPKPAGTGTDELLGAWNEIGRKVVALAEDCPEAKYDAKPVKDARNFREVLLHIAGSNYFFIHTFGGPKLGDDSNDPKPETYKTRAQVVAFVKKSFADGAAMIRQQGEAGLRKEVKDPFANKMIHAQAWWYVGVSHGAEHYGNLVTYYRAQGMVPPESRPQK